VYQEVVDISHSDIYQFDVSGKWLGCLYSSTMIIYICTYDACLTAVPQAL
jgi:hypothetical protein